jgi:hypothetical protein
LRPGLGGIGDGLIGIYILGRHGDNAYEQDSQYNQTINAYLFDLKFHLIPSKKLLKFILSQNRRQGDINRSILCIVPIVVKSPQIRKQKTASGILI